MSRLTRIQSGVQRALTAAGLTCTVQVIASEYDPQSASVTETVTAHTVRCTDTYDDVQASDSEGSTIRRTANILVEASTAFTPAPGNRVLLGGRKFQVLDVERYGFAGTAVAYRLAVHDIAPG